MEVRLCKT